MPDGLLPVDDYLIKLDAYLRYIYADKGKIVYKDETFNTDDEVNDFIKELKNYILYTGTISSDTPFFLEVAIQTNWLPQSLQEQAALSAKETKGLELSERDMALQERLGILRGATEVSAEAWRKYGAEQQQWLGMQELTQREKALDWQKTQWQSEMATRMAEAQTQRMTAEEARKAQVAQLGAQDLMMRLQGNREWATQQQQQADLATQYDQIKRQVLSSIEPTPRNWITMYRAQNTPNPYRPQPMDAQQQLAFAEDEAKRLGAAANNIYKRMKDPNDQLTRETVANPRTTEQQLAKITIDAAKNAQNVLDEMRLARSVGTGTVKDPYAQEIAQRYPEQTEAGKWAQPRPIGGGNFEVGAPETREPPVSTMPEIPGWLSMASGVGGRVPTERVPLQIPSGQSWQRLEPTQQQMFAGLADWAGVQTFEDIMAQMQRQQPYTPSVPGGWIPRIQRGMA